MKSSHWRLLNLALWALALLLAGWTLRQLPVAEILPRLGMLGLQDWLLWITVNCSILYLSVRRWQVLAAAAGEQLSITALLRMRQAGAAVSFITPGPQFGGEPLQLFWLHRIYRLALHRAAAVLGLDRFMETAFNLAILLAGVLMLLGTAIMSVQAWLQVSAILAATLVTLAGATALLLRHPDWLAKRLGRLTGRWRPAADSDSQGAGWRAFAELVQQVLSQQQRRLWIAMGLSLATWGLLLLELVLLLKFLGLALVLMEVVLIMVGMRLAMLLPMPGGIGTVEASLLWSFSFLGLPAPAAVGLIALSRLRDAALLVIGLLCLVDLQRATIPSARTGTDAVSGRQGNPVE